MATQNTQANEVETEDQMIDRLAAEADERAWDRAEMAEAQTNEN